MEPQLDGTTFQAGPAATGESVDPATIAKMVEREVSTMFELAQLSADQITARAAEAAREVEAMIAQLQQSLARLGQQVHETVDRIAEAGKATATPPGGIAAAGGSSYTSSSLIDLSAARRPAGEATSPEATDPAAGTIPAPGASAS